MEAEMQVKQVKRLAQELEQYTGRLSSGIRQLDALCESRYMQPVEKKLRIQSDFLKRQCSLCKDLAAVLERAGYLYEKTEESIIQAAEADVGRRYQETLNTVSLSRMPQIPVTLK